MVARMHRNSGSLVKHNACKVMMTGLLLAAAAGAWAGEFKVQRAAPYAADAIIAGNIKRECTIDSQLVDALRRSGLRQVLARLARPHGVARRSDAPTVKRWLVLVVR